jgi:enterochelin esterase-like enzyme
MKKYLLIMIVSLIAGCGTAPAATPRIPLICDQPGQVESLRFYSEIQSYDYTYNVYLPPCYNESPDRRYPVLYLIPGRGGGPDDWFNAGAMDIFNEVILSESVPPFIVVSTKNFSEDPYGDVLYKELMPIIEADFRTLNDREHRAIAGGSLGAVSSYRMAFQYPDTFASAGMFGGGLIHGEEPMFEEWLSTLTPENQPRVFLNSGEGDPLMLDRARVMVTYLDEAGIENELVSGPGDHTYGYWLKAFPRYLIWMALDW